MMNLILFGFKRCGKTHFGKRLAEKLGYDFIDTDHLIEGLFDNKLTSRQIAERIGLPEFRKLETQAIQTLMPKDKTIISVGGGAVLDPNNVNMLKKIGRLVYLELDEETLKKRTLEHLPSYLDPSEPLASFEKMVQEREPIYEQIDAVKLNIAEKSEEEVLTMLSHIAKEKI